MLSQSRDAAIVDCLVADDLRARWRAVQDSSAFWTRTPHPFFCLVSGACEAFEWAEYNAAILRNP